MATNCNIKKIIGTQYKKRNKIVILGILALFASIGPVYAQDSPMDGWVRGEFGTYFTLKGRRFWFGELPETWREQDGYAIVSGRKLHYWLYDSYTYHDGKSEFIYNKAIPGWVEKMGYVIDFDNIVVYNPNPNLASSVKTLMQQRACDVCVALVTDNPAYDYVVINEYFKSKGTYKTTVYPLYK
jgi:hypothetical protein